MPDGFWIGCSRLMPSDPRRGVPPPPPHHFPASTGQVIVVHGAVPLMSSTKMPAEEPA